MPVLSFGEIHPRVKAALDYELPENACGIKPKSFELTVAIFGDSVQAAGALNVFDESETDEISDLDNCSRKRQQRKITCWKKCTKEYKSALLSNMDELESSAQHELTKLQVDLILANMATI